MLGDGKLGRESTTAGLASTSKSEAEGRAAPLLRNQVRLKGDAFALKWFGTRLQVGGRRRM